MYITVPCLSAVYAGTGSFVSIDILIIYFTRSSLMGSSYASSMQGILILIHGWARVDIGASSTAIAHFTASLLQHSMLVLLS